MDKLHALQSQVETAMTAIGFESENRPYRPHVTIAKNYQGEQFDMERWTDRWDEEMGTLPEWTVESIVLYRTDLGTNIPQEESKQLAYIRTNRSEQAITWIGDC